MAVCTIGSGPSYDYCLRPKIVRVCEIPKYCFTHGSHVVLITVHFNAYVMDPVGLLRKLVGMNQ